MLRAVIISPFMSQSLRPIISIEKHEDLVVLKELIEAGKVTPIIDKRFPLSETANAIRYLKGGRARGKLVISVRGSERCLNPNGTPSPAEN